MSDIIIKKRILISNDDGVDSPGIIELAKAFSKQNEVLVVAPDGNRSSISHAISPFKKVKLNKVEGHDFPIYSLSGTPVDCVKFANLVFKDFKPNVIISGINKGHNIGTDTNYSGTLSIALEGVFFNCISFAFSAFSLDNSDFKILAEYAVKIYDELLTLNYK